MMAIRIVAATILPNILRPSLENQNFARRLGWSLAKKRLTGFLGREARSSALARARSSAFNLAFSRCVRFLVLVFNSTFLEILRPPELEVTLFPRRVEAFSLAFLSPLALPR